jgi:hypothetical protein
MKWNYKKCNVTITVNYESLPMISLMPVVEIDCEEAARSPRSLTTNKSFPNFEEAERFGSSMVRNWIDEHPRG